MGLTRLGQLIALFQRSWRRYTINEQRVTGMLLLAYLLLKPFYIFDSGSMQIADVFLVIAFVLICCGAIADKSWRMILARVTSDNRLFAYFVIAAAAINSIYFFLYPESRFVLSTLYFVFNLIVIVCFAVFIKDKAFLRKMGLIFKFNLVVQLLIWAFKLGDYFGSDRYMGTFNDPNQFGYYVFMSFLCIHLIDHVLGEKRTYLYFILTLALALLSSSTGVILGLGVLGVVYIVRTSYLLIKKRSCLTKKATCYTVAVLALFMLALTALPVLVPRSGQQGPLNGDLTLINRLEEKMKKAQGEADISLWEDRGLDTISKYPRYLLYGAGEGAYARFVGVVHVYNGEIHSTIPALFFYYGFFPASLVLAWIYVKLRNSHIEAWGAYGALLAVSFTLVNYRQALLWLFIMLAGYYYKKATPTKENGAQT